MSVYAILFAQDFLKRIRQLVTENQLSLARLPSWVKVANVKMAKLNNSNLFLFEDALDEHDAFFSYGMVKSDLEFFLGLPQYIPRTAVLKVPDKAERLIQIIGGYGAEERVVFNIKASSSKSSFFNAGYVPYHSPLSIVNICFKLSVLDDVLGICFIPFSLYVHDVDFVDDFSKFWGRCDSIIRDTLIALHNSSAGDYYQLSAEKKTAFLANKEKSVIVFGKYAEPELHELIQVRDYLISKGYDAHLLRELPEHPSMSMEQKVRLWSSATRFSVMVDREPSGHLVEYPYIKDERVILAHLTPKGKPSTYMIGDESLVDLRYIKPFEFEKSPLETIDAAISWAENMVKERIRKYGAVYPWR